MKGFIAVLVFLISSLCFGQTQPNYDATAGNGNGFRFWNGSNSYKIHMGNSAEYKFGPVQDYSIKMNMNNDPDRGWTWGVTGLTPVAALSTGGNFQIGGYFQANQYIAVNKGGSYRVAMNGQGDGYLTGRNDNVENRFLIHSNGNTYFNGGNVGIGTTNPNSNLQIGDSNNTGSPNSEVEVKRLSLAPVTHSSSDWFFTTRDNNPYANLDIGYSSNKALTIRHDGRVGIGITSPAQELDVNGEVQSKGFVLLDSQLGSNSDYTALYRDDTGNDNAVVKLRIGDDYLGAFNIGYRRWQDGDWVSTFYVDNSGKVGIGTITPGNYQLAVNGKIHTKEVKVDLSGWSDFVFEKDYNIPTLQEVENHIAEKGHLQDIPSAKEVAENGIFLGEMDAKLLQKIEELMLYTIAQEKQLKAQQTENKHETTNLYNRIADCFYSSWTRTI